MMLMTLIVQQKYKCALAVFLIAFKRDRPNIRRAEQNNDMSRRPNLRPNVKCKGEVTTYLVGQTFNRSSIQAVSVDDKTNHKNAH